MTYLEVRGVVKKYGRVTALAGADLTVEAGSLTAVLGPSGCGKTTLLKCITGFEPTDSGEILLDGRTVSGPGVHIAPHRRRVAIVPQEGALFPHLSVRDNVRYGLNRDDRRSNRAQEVLELVGLAGHADRMPHQLSGGQQQRVAVARALAPRPSLILLDEPFSALDAGLRAGLRDDVRTALRAAGTTAIIITHDQSEALSLADRVAVMRAGIVVQAAAPDAVYHRPGDPWVARFVGDATLLSATVQNGIAETALGPIPLVDRGLRDLRPGTRITVLVRPEQVCLGSDLVGRSVAAKVEDSRFHGREVHLTLRAAGEQIHASVANTTPGVAPGDTVSVHVAGPVWAWAL